MQNFSVLRNRCTLSPSAESCLFESALEKSQSKREEELNMAEAILVKLFWKTNPEDAADETD